MQLKCITRNHADSFVLNRKRIKIRLHCSLLARNYEKTISVGICFHCLLLFFLYRSKTLGYSKSEWLSNNKHWKWDRNTRKFICVLLGSLKKKFFDWFWFEQLSEWCEMCTVRIWLNDVDNFYAFFNVYLINSSKMRFFLRYFTEALRFWHGK